MKPVNSTTEVLKKGCTLTEGHPTTATIFIQTSLDGKDGKEKIFGSRKLKKTAH
jgi:hypothetical protein